jgi:DNA-binding NarL/FixJ family response regulator
VVAKRKLRVLVADDFVTVRKGVCAILESRGDIVCAEASNGAEAVRTATELKPDIVLMDFTMPEMNGLEASKRILQLVPGMPILILSRHTMETLTEAAKDAGIGGFIVKGASESKLLEAVDKVLRKEPFFVTYET